MHLQRPLRAREQGQVITKEMKMLGTSQYQNVSIFFVSVSYYSFLWLIFSSARSVLEVGME